MVHGSVVEKSVLNVEEKLMEFRKIWPQLVRQIASAFSYSEEKKQWMERKDVAQLIGAIPFLAGCKNPYQTAGSHLATYLLSVEKGSKSIFHHREWVDDSDLLNRLKPIMNFDGGNELIIKRGMDLLALTMVCGYQKDIEKDQGLNKYNPVSSGVWDYESVKQELISRIESNPCPCMDEIFDIGPGTRGIWGGD